MRAISLKLERVPLGDALRAMSEQTDVDLVYSDSVVDSLLVSCDFSFFSVESALKRLLRQTSIAYRRTSANTFVLFLKAGKLTVDVAGRVADSETGEVLPYANVSLLRSNHGSSTNPDGRFVIPSVAFATCSLRVSYIGYAEQILRLPAAELAQEVRIELRQQTIMAEPVTVHPEQWQMVAVGEEPGSLTVAPENVALLPIIGGKDVIRTLQLLPGIGGNQGSSGLYVRGGTPSQNLVLFDGMTLYHLDHSFGFFSAFNSDAIKDVRVFKSNFPARYGGRLSGVMEITSKSGDFENPRLQVGANMLSGHSVLEVPLAGRGALLLSVRRSYSNYILDDLYERNFAAFITTIPRQHVQSGAPIRRNGESTSEPDIFFYDVIGKASLALNNSNRVALSFYAGQDDLERFESLTSPATPGRGHHSREQSGFVSEESTELGNRGFSFKWFRQFSERWHSTAMAAYSRYTSDQSFFEKAPALAADPRFGGQGPPAGSAAGDSVVAEISSYNRIEDASWRWDNTVRLHPAHELEFGTWISRTSMLYRNSGFHIVDNLPRDNSAIQQAYYLQDTWQAPGRLTLTGGMRAVHYGLTSQTFLEPRLSVNLRLRPALALRGGWGRSHQFVRLMPSFFQYTDGRDFWVLADGRGTKPGSAEQWSAGVSVTGGSLLLDVEYYENRQEEVTEGIPSVQYMEPLVRSQIFRDNRSTSHGIDVLLQKTSGRLSGWLGYGYGETTIDAFVRRELRIFPANQDIRHKLSLVGNVLLNGWNLSVTWSYASGAPFTRPEAEVVAPADAGTLLRLTAPARLNAERLPATHRLDLSLTRAFVTRHIYGNIGFSVYNLYDQENVWYRNFVLEEGEVVQEDVLGLGLTPSISLDLRLR